MKLKLLLPALLAISVLPLFGTEYLIKDSRPCGGIYLPGTMNKAAVPAKIENLVMRTSLSKRMSRISGAAAPKISSPFTEPTPMALAGSGARARFTQNKVFIHTPGSCKP